MNYERRKNGGQITIQNVFRKKKKNYLECGQNSIIEIWSGKVKQKKKNLLNFYFAKKNIY